ncbi:motile sperm domain-containing protein 1 [Esox lucius]|uniref:MSP domain-containing protein n=1 Tax=Esox lucius TaxID=8010 RepID=A0A3P8Z1T4_ESOLU|nr:motile sperm domain-containing protein 1 [Esox lucius]XP_019900440.1 motile sperm domain-containing protein 1 [Esox lucius]
MHQQPMKGAENGTRGEAEGGGVRRRGERVERGDSSTSPSPHETPPTPLPVFLFPSELVFYSGQRSSHRRVLTLYNPYTFTIMFKMLCTSPSRYSVVEAEGSVRAKSCIDLVVRHKDVSPRHWGRRDRFRLEVSGGGQEGSREVWAELKGGGGGVDEPRSTPTTPSRHALPSSLTPLPYFKATQAVRSPLQFAVLVVMGVVCVAILMLPLHSEPNHLVPSYAHVTVTQKLVCAYTLGLLTMVFLQ